MTFVWNLEKGFFLAWNGKKMVWLRLGRIATSYAEGNFQLQLLVINVSTLYLRSGMNPQEKPVVMVDSLVYNPLVFLGKQ